MKIKKFLKYFSREVIIIILALFVISSLAYAYFELRSILVECEIILGPKHLAIYCPPNYETDIHGIKYAIFQRGTSHSTLLLLKNTGVEPIVDLKVKTNPEVISWSDVSFSPSSFGTLTSGQSANMTIYIYVHPDAPTGNVTFQILFYEP